MARILAWYCETDLVFERSGFSELLGESCVSEIRSTGLDFFFSSLSHHARVLGLVSSPGVWIAWNVRADLCEAQNLPHSPPLSTSSSLVLPRR